MSKLYLPVVRLTFEFSYTQWVAVPTTRATGFHSAGICRHPLRFRKSCHIPWLSRPTNMLRLAGSHGDGGNCKTFRATEPPINPRVFSNTWKNARRSSKPCMLSIPFDKKLATIDVIRRWKRPRTVFLAKVLVWPYAMMSVRLRKPESSM